MRTPLFSKLRKTNGTEINAADAFAADGSVNVTVVAGGAGGGGGATAEDVTLLNAVTATGPSTLYTVAAKQTLTLEISGTATSATVDFRGHGPSGTARSVFGVRKSDAEIATSGTMNELWTFEIAGLTSFSVNLSAVAGGNVSVRGKAV